LAIGAVYKPLTREGGSRLLSPAFAELNRRAGGWFVLVDCAGETSQGADADAARVRALAAYKDFLTRWKDADPDIPILKQAKAEYAKLQ